MTRFTRNNQSSKLSILLISILKNKKFPFGLVGIGFVLFQLFTQSNLSSELLYNDIEPQQRTTTTTTTATTTDTVNNDNDNDNVPTINSSKLRTITTSTTTTTAAAVAVATTTIKSNRTVQKSNNNNINTTAMKKQISLPLGSFENGGVVLFFHIPKSGGTTIRNLFTNINPNVKYYFPMGVHKLRDILDKDWKDIQLNGIKNNTIHFIEIHDFNVPSLRELNFLIKQWKKTSIEKQFSFFTFSVFREPMSFHLSYFNYYHIQRPAPKNGYPKRNATEEDFIKSISFNPQCIYLSRGEFAWHDAYRNSDSHWRRPFSKEDCDNNYKILQEQMDYVGTTDKLDETIELVSNITHISLDSTSIEKSNKSRKYISYADLSSDAIRYMKNISTFDVELYDKIQQYWSIDDWKQLLQKDKQKQQ